MPVQKKKLKVLPNPWTYIDHQGRPAGRVAVEQPKDGFDPRSVGARIADNPELVSQARKGVPLAQDIHEIEIEYSKEPVEVANTDYYRKRVIRGDLIAADRESFVAAGGRPKDFEAHQKHVDAKKAEAMAQFDIDNGAGAFEALALERAETAALRKAVAASVAGEQAAVEPTATPESSPKPAEAKKGGGQ